jgi:hypothetical protein
MTNLQQGSCETVGSSDCWCDGTVAFGSVQQVALAQQVVFEQHLAP